ncbi:MAG: glycosyltransferase [Bacteroidetes bacterium]|nr:glycosyltransferase [Bacteroidota bacterium]
MNSLVSIIIPAYNSSKYLSETLENVLSQTYDNFECLIIDDGSTDDTGAIAKSYVEKDSRMRYYYQENAGSAAARNTGLKFSTGEFIQFLDADDLIHPEKLKIQMNYLMMNQLVDIVFGQVIFFNKSGNVNFNSVIDYKNNLTKRVNGKNHDVLKYLIQDNIMPVHSALLRRKVVGVIGIFDVNLKSCEDYDFWFRAALSDCYFSYDNDPKSTCYYRRHNDNKSSSSSRLSYYRTLVIQKQLDKINKNYHNIYSVLFNVFLLNHKKYLFGKNEKYFTDVVYTFDLALKHRSIRLLFINMQYLIMPNRIWNLLYWNGGLMQYLKIKIKNV